MVVAACAVDGEADECLCDGRRDFFQFILAGSFFHELGPAHHGVVDAGGEKCGGGQPVFAWDEDIAGDLSPDELVVGHVCVQGVDHPVAEVPLVFPDEVPFEAIAFAEAGDVEPVPSPALAVVWAGEEVVDEFCVCCIAGIGDERIHLSGGRG